MFYFKIDPTVRQYIIVISSACSFFQVGIHMAWLSPLLIQLKNEEQKVFTDVITDSQISWLVSISNLTGFFAIMFTGFLSDQLGRKYTIIIGYAPRIITCLIFLVASDVKWLLFGRAIDGISDVIACSVNSSYASEIASKEIRGRLGTISHIMSASGTMLVLTVGPFLDYTALTTVITCLAVTTFVPLLFLPESPYLLYSKGKLDESRNVLTLIRNKNDDIETELKEFSLNLNNKEKTNKFDLLKDPVVLKSCGKVLFLGIGAQLTGSNTVMFYLQSIFESTHTSLRPEISSVIIGCIQIIAGCLTFALTDKFGRKPILVITLIGMTIGMVGLGTFFELKEYNYTITGFFNYLPLISIVLIIFGFNAGIGATIWTLSSELFNGPARAMGVSLAVMGAILTIFLLTLFFGSLSLIIGAAGIYWIFTCCCLVTCLFIIFFIPETNGKSFSEIQRDLGRDNVAFEGSELAGNCNGMLS